MREGSESVTSYADRLRKYKEENENLRQMLSVNSIDQKPAIKPIKFIDKLIARSLSNVPNGIKDKQGSRNKTKGGAVFQDTQETMFETSPMRE